MAHLLSLPVTIILLVVLAVFSFFLSASETSVIGLSKIRLRHMVSRGIKGALKLQNLVFRLDKFISAILVLNNLANIAISSIVTAMCIWIFGYKLGIVVATFSTAFFLVILCEITPKILAIKYTEKIALLAAPVMEALIKVFKPVIMIFNGAGNLLIRLLRIQSAKKSPLVTEEELRLMIEIGKEEGFVSEEESLMLQRIFEFGDTKVGDIMVPAGKMVAVDIKTSAEELLDIFAEQEHSRLPVYKDNKDNIVGIVYARDLHYILREKDLFVLQDLMFEPYFIRKETKVSEVMKRFQADKVQIAVVVNDQKRSLGMVTLEDLIEEIVGEIEEKPAFRARSNKV